MKIIRISEVKEMMGFKADGSIRNLIGKGLFTPPVKIGERAVGWPDYEIEEILKARISGQSAKDIRLLVNRLRVDREKSPGS
jgi:prophage regulatory protein